MLRYPKYSRDRIRQLVERLQTKIHRETRPIEQLRVSPPTDRITRAEALQLEFRPVQLGEQFGPLWTTFWFKATAVIPPEWQGERVDLLWVSHSEATLWLEGWSAQGLNYEPAAYDRSVRSDALLLARAAGGETIEFEVEMACNSVFGGDPGFKQTFSSVSPFVFDRCDLAVFDPAAAALYYDLVVLQMLEAESAGPKPDLDGAWSGELLHELNRVANLLDPDDRATWPAAREIAQTTLPTLQRIPGA